MDHPPESTRRRQVVILAALLLLGAVALWRALKPAPPLGDRTYWYDLSEKKLYVAPAELTPPQDGVGGTSADAYPAVVICWEADPRKRTVAFVTSFTDELRDLHAQAREARKQGQPPPDKIGDRLWVTANTLVRAPDSDQWVSKSSPAGLAVISILTTRGPDGTFPRICSPDD